MRFRSGWAGGTCGRPFYGSDVDLFHLEHGPHGALGPLRVGVAQERGQPVRDYLPRKAVLVLEPTARPFLAPFREPAPEVVDLVLRGAVDYERNRLVEVEFLRPPVQGEELLAVQFKAHDHCRPRCAGASVAVTGHFEDSRCVEHRGVKVGSLFGLRTEPQKWSDLVRDAHPFLFFNWHGQVDDSDAVGHRFHRSQASSCTSSRGVPGNSRRSWDATEPRASSLRRER